MSAQGDAGLIRAIREKMQEQINSELLMLAVNTTERKAGHVQGLMDALEFFTDTYRQMMDTDRPPQKQD